LRAAIKRFQAKPDYRAKCFLSLKIDEIQIPTIIDGIDLLSSDLELAITERVFKEEHDMFA
jgi:hypothetical protein